MLSLHSTIISIVLLIQQCSPYGGASARNSPALHVAYVRAKVFARVKLAADAVQRTVTQRAVPPAHHARVRRNHVLANTSADGLRGRKESACT